MVWKSLPYRGERVAPFRWVAHEVWTKMRKPTVDAGSTGVPPYHFTDPKVQKAYPKLFEAMASSVYDDGSKKGPGMLIIKPRARGLSVTLKVENSGLMLRTEGETWEEMMSALEALLRADTPPWEEDPYQVVKGPKKKSG